MTILQNDRKEINDLIRGSEKIVEIYSGYQVLENKQRQKAYITIVTNETDGIKTAAVFLLWKCAGNCIGIYEIMSLKEGLFKIKVAMRPREKSSDKDKDKQKEKEKDKVTVFTEEVEPKEHITALKNKYGIETFEVEDTTTIKYMDQEILCIFNADGGARAFRERIREYIFPSADKELMEKQFQWINYYGTSKKMLLELGVPNGYQQGKSIVKIVDDSERFTRDLIGERLEMRKSEYTLENKVKIMIGTWNVAGNDPPENVDNWLFGDPELLADEPKGSKSRLAKYDPMLLVIGLQEMDLSAGSYVYYDVTKENEWTHCINKSLQHHGLEYVKVASKQLVGMMLLVFCKNTEVDRIRQVQSYHMGLGLLGYMGNKGGVGIRMRIDETSIVFVNSHLVHEEGNASKRNYQFQELIKRMEFKGELKDVNLDATKTSMDSDDRKGSVGGQRQQLQQEKEIMEVKKIFDSSYVFWFGDLNYRIEAPTNIINNLLGTGNYKLLLGLDQLYISREKRLAFEMFTEEEIKFLPTYRYIQGTANFDPKRNPAWCDRILYWKNPKLSGGSSNPVSANISRNTSGNLSIGASGNTSGNTSGNISRNASAIFKGDTGENASRNTGGDASDKSVDKQQLGAANATQQMSVQQSEQVTEPAVTMAVEPRSVSSPGPSVFTGLSSGPVLRTEGVEVGPEPGGRISGSDNSSTGYNTSVNKGGVIKCYEYNSEPSQNTSDHKPVFGIFEIDTVGFSPEKYSQVYSTILEEMNIKENASMPIVSIRNTSISGVEGEAGEAEGGSCSNEINFGKIEYGKRYSGSLTLTNLSKDGIKFEFVSSSAIASLPNTEKPGAGSGGGSDRITDNNGICNDSQIWVNPVKGVVLPGSQVEIEAIIYKTKGESEGEKIVLSIADPSLVQNEGDRSSGSGADTDVSKKQETKEIQQQKDEAIAPAGDSESPQASSTAAKQEAGSNPSIIENGNSVVEAKGPISTDIPGGGSGSDSSGSSDSSDSGNTSVINEKSTESKEDSIDEDDYLVYYEKAVKPNTDHNKNNDTSGSNDSSGRHDEILVLRIVGGRDIFIVMSYEL